MSHGRRNNGRRRELALVEPEVVDAELVPARRPARRWAQAAAPVAAVAAVSGIAAGVATLAVVRRCRARHA